MNYRRWEVLILGALMCVATCGAAFAATNLALTATASAEVVPNGSYPPSNANDGNYSTLYWGGSGSYTPNALWYQLTWGSSQEFNTVVAYFLSHAWGHGRTITLQQEVSTDVWQDIATTVVVTTATPNGEFDVATFTLPANVTLDKIRVVNLIDLFEVEVYKSAEVSVSGSILTDNMPFFVGGATIKAGTTSTKSACGDGTYQLSVMPGEYAFEVSAPGYAKVTETVTVPAEGLVKNFSMAVDTADLALTATATASSYIDTGYESYPPSAAANGFPCDYWEAADSDYGDEWFQLEWASAVVVDTVTVDTGSAANPATVEVWKDGAWLLVGMIDVPTFPLTFQFSPVETTKVRINKLGKAYEVEVHNKLGPVQPPNVTGVVTNSLTGLPVVQARVAVGDQTCFTSATGAYGLTLPEGSATINVTKMCYDNASAGISVPASGTITRDFVLTTKNIAPTASSVTASLEVPGSPGSNCADDRSDTSWKAGAVIWGTYVELQWASEVTFDKVQVHGGSGLGQSLYLQVDYWNGSAWRYAGNRAVTAEQWNSTVALQFYPITTTKIRVSGAFVITELEVDQCAPANPSVEPIPNLRALPDGAQVRVSGSVTAGFEDIDSAYVETVDRSAAIRCMPWSAFPSTSGPNIAPLATASASIVPLEQYPPSYANDGDTGTEYYPGATAVGTNPNGEWLQYSWSEPQTFNKVVVYMPQHPVSHGRVCTLQRYSSGTSAWEDFASASGSTETSTPYSYVVFNLDTPVTLDQVRFTNPVDIFEMQVFLTGGNSIDREVTVDGMMATAPSGQRYIQVGPIVMGSVNALTPLAMNNKALNGGGGGINTSSLLAKVAGTVTAVIPGTTTQYAYIDDGSAVQADPTAPRGVKVGPMSTSLCKEGDHISAAGIVQYAPAPNAIRPRSDDDVVVNLVGAPQVNIAPSATATAEANPAGYELLYGPDKAIDGNKATEYYPGGGGLSPNTYWLQLTWGSPQTINRVLAYYMANAQFFSGRIITLQRETSPDVWENISSVSPITIGSFSIAMFALPSPLTTDKIRVINMFDLWEVEVY